MKAKSYVYMGSYCSAFFENQDYKGNAVGCALIQFQREVFNCL
jgi:hypothetical protein